MVDLKTDGTQIIKETDQTYLGAACYHFGVAISTHVCFQVEEEMAQEVGGFINSRNGDQIYLISSKKVSSSRKIRLIPHFVQVFFF